MEKTEDLNVLGQRDSEHLTFSDKGNICSGLENQIRLREIEIRPLRRGKIKIIGEEETIEYFR